MGGVDFIVTQIEKCRVNGWLLSYIGKENYSTQYLATTKHLYVNTLVKMYTTSSIPFYFLEYSSKYCLAKITLKTDQFKVIESNTVKHSTLHKYSWEHILYFFFLLL
jgi:hypothetical protein